MVFSNISRWREDCPGLRWMINDPATTHFDGWIWLLISSAQETPTNTECNSTYSHGTKWHDIQSLTYLSMQHWIQPKVFIFRVSGTLGLAYIYSHTLLNDACEQFWPYGYLEFSFFYSMAELSLCKESFMRSCSEIVRLAPMGVNDYCESYLLLHVGNSFWTCFFLWNQRLCHAN